MKNAVNVEGAPAAVGPYVHAVKTGELTFLSGQLGLDPETGALGETIEEQTTQSLENVKMILEGLDLEMSDVVKTTIFLADIGDFGKVNEIYAKYFTEPYPARSCVQAGALPKGGLVEIEAIAAEK